MKKIIFFLLLTITVNSFAQTSADNSYKLKNVAILLYDGVELLDFAGPGEVFQQAEVNGNKAFNVYTVGVQTKEIISQGFLNITVEYLIDDCPLPDILVIPGGNSMSQVNNEKLISWIASVNQNAEFILSVCNGVRLLAKTGALDGMKATSHFRAIDNLTKEFPNVEMVKGKRFVDNGRIITTEGVSAGIDGSLYLLSKILSKEIANEVAKQMMYSWNPEALNVILPNN
ncbi:MAG TPA: DJ-1/PfpI family protein [Saprospiraceae bacterium]|nr:DJ-1/PfpI family protein [Saprospiraceae bacterium]